MNWEYLSFEPRLVRDSDETRSDYLTRKLNEFGQEGWELVNYIDHRYVFKRPLTAKSAKKTK